MPWILVVFLMLSLPVGAQEQFEVKELNKEQQVRLEELRRKAREALAALQKAEKELRIAYGENTTQARFISSGIRCYSIDVEIRGKYALITKQDTGLCQELTK